MIITIKGADFSSANIGTLSTYIISKSIGSGATFDIPNFVDKNSSVNWVITLDEGYTFGTYSITMGGDVITPSVVDNVMTISIAEVTGNVRIVVATVNESTGEEDEPTIPDEPVVPPVEPDNISVIMDNFDVTPSTILGKAYVANMNQKIPSDVYIKHIDLVTNSSNQSSISGINVWVFDADTNTLIEKIVDNQTITTQLSEYANKQVLRIEIKRQWDKPIYFGYYCDKSVNGNKSAYYYSESGNYLSNTEFEQSVALSPTEGSVAICAQIYGVKPVNNEYEQVCSFNPNAKMSLAGNCWVANVNDIIPSNTQIDKIEVYGDGNIQGINVAVINANNLTLVEYLVTEQNLPSKFSMLSSRKVVTIDTDKKYDFPVLLMFNAERTSKTQDTLFMIEGMPSNSGILYVDDQEGTMGSPEVGHTFTATSMYAIGYNIFTQKS